MTETTNDGIWFLGHRWFLYDRFVKAYDPRHTMNDAQLADALGVSRSTLWFAATHNRQASKALVRGVARLLPRRNPRSFFAFGAKPESVAPMRHARPSTLEKVA